MCGKCKFIAPHKEYSAPAPVPSRRNLAEAHAGPVGQTGRLIAAVANRVPQPFILDVPSPIEVDAAIDRALSRPPELMAAIRAHGDDIHPYRDGHSSERVLDAVDAFHRGEFGTLKRKPLNLVRRFKALRDIGALLDLR